MERTQIVKPTVIRKPSVNSHLTRPTAATVLSRSVERSVEPERRDLTQPRLQVDLTKVPVHSGEQVTGSPALLAAPSSVMGIRVVTALRPQEKKPKCAACQAAGSVSESCPKCAKGAARAGRPREAADGRLRVSGGPEPDKDEPAQCSPSALAARNGEILRDRVSRPREAGWSSFGTGARPQEAGWWTSRTPTSNTIGCDGSGSLVVMQNGSSYLHGVTDCSIQHEQVHVNDWLARYGNNICSGRANGDLPHYDPPGQAAYATFLDQSECRAWTVGAACRRQKLADCTTDACRSYVQEHVDFADTMVNRHCGLSTGAKAAIGALAGAAAGAGIGALVGGPIGALAGGAIGAGVGALGSLLF